MVGWGIHHWISVSGMFKQLLVECPLIPAQAFPLLLPLVAPEEDTVLALQTEYFLSAEVVERAGFTNLHN